MAATMSNPRDVYLTLLADMLYVERTLSAEVLPKLLGEVSDPLLAGVIAGHLEQTKGHVGSVEQAFRAAGAETSSNRSAPFAALVEQHEELSSSAAAAPLGDLLHLDAALHTESYEIASYRVLVPLAESVAPDAREALRQILAEEEDASASLQKLLPDLARAGSVTTDARA